MLLQIEILLWIVSVLIIIIAPLVRLWRFVIRRYRSSHQQQWESTIDQQWEEKSSDVVDDQESDSSPDDISPDDVGDTPPVYQDPVIAALRQEEQQTQDDIDWDIQETEDHTQEEQSEDEIIIIEQIVELPEEEIISEESIEEEIEETIEDDVIIEETIDVIEIDVDGDGVTDETIVIDTIVTTSAADLSEAKRQKSIEMFQFELRNLKDKGQTAVYEKKLIEARALHHDRTDFAMMLAEHYYDQSEYKKALGLYRKLVESDSTDDKSLSMIANCYIKLGEWENAQLILEKLVQEKPENPRYWMSLAEVYYNFKNIDKTIDCVRTMVKLRPSNMDYLSTLAQLYHESAYYDLYVQILYRMLELDPLNHEIKSEIEKYS